MRLAIKNSGLSGAALARKAGVAASTVNKHISGKAKTILKSDTISDIAAAAGIPPLSDEIAQVPVDIDMTRKFNPQSSGEPDLPMMGRAIGGEDGMVELNGTVLDRVPRPHQLKDVPDAYGVYMNGESMLPKYEAGQALYIHPHRSPRVGNFVVIELEDHRAFVKQLVKREATSITVRQFNPDRTFEIPLNQVINLHRIVSSDEI